MKRLISTILLCFLFVGSTSAQIGIPYFRSFAPKEFSSKNYDSSPQIFSVIQDERGVMYMANASGILEFDGKYWSMVKGSEGLNFLSFAKDSTGRLYAAGINELGFLSADSTGKIIYQSLKKFVPAANKSDIGSFYNTCSIENNVFFQSEKKIFLWNGKKFQVFTSDKKYIKSFVTGGNYYVQDSQKGLLKFYNNKFIIIFHQEELNESIRILISKGHKLNDESFLIGTNKNNFYLFENGRISPFTTTAEQYFKANLVESGTQIINGDFAIGTNHGGLVILDYYGRLKTIVNKESGISDNYIGNIYEDKTGGLWLCHDLGVTRIEVNSPLTFFTPVNNFDGIILNIVRFKGQLYLGTTNGVYILNDSDGKFIKVKDIFSQAFKLLPFYDELLVATPYGVFSVKSDKGVKISDAVSIDLLASTVDINKVYVGLADGMKVLRKQKDKWVDEGNIEGFSMPAYRNAILHTDIIWSGDEQTGITKIDLSKKKIDIQYYDTSAGLPAGRIRPSVVDNKLYLGSNTGIYQYDPVKNKFFAKRSGITAPLNIARKEGYSIQKDLRENIWMVSEGRVGYITEDKSGVKWNATATKRIPQTDVWTYFIENSGIGWIGNNDGLIRYDTRFKKEYDQKYHTLIRKVTVNGSRVIFSGAALNASGKVDHQQPSHLKPVIPNEENTITFEYSSLNYDYLEGNAYKCKLEGYDPDWTDWNKDNMIRYTNLGPGHYVFKVKAINCYDTESETAQFEFTVGAPYYLTWWAFLGYGAGVFGIYFTGLKLNARRHRKEKKVLERIVSQRTHELQKQKEIVEGQNKDIKDSIQYAKKIQEAIVPTEKMIKESYLENCFVLYKPKDIVSGDFYWVEKSGDEVLAAAVDCTGHGVPGAFMSIVGFNLLNQAVKEQNLTQPAAILDYLNKGVTMSLRQTMEGSTVKDGMDIALIALNRKTKKVQFAGANNSMYHIRNGVINEIKANKQPIGIFIGEELKPFTNHQMSYEDGDAFYLFSDGYADQFGGPKGKKFKYKNFESLLLEIYRLDMQEQKSRLNYEFEKWKGDLPQIDDICVFGIRV